MKGKRMVCNINIYNNSYDEEIYFSFLYSYNTIWSNHDQWFENNLLTEKDELSGQGKREVQG